MTKTLVDLHIHSNSSMDAIHSIDEIVNRAKKYNVQTIAITDHNTADGVHDFFRNLNYPDNAVMVNYQDVEIFAGVEVTVRLSEVENLSNKSSKFHIVCYGFDRSPNSPIMKLLKLKRQNDIENDLSYFVYLSNNYNIKFDMDELRLISLSRKMFQKEFQEFKKEDVINYLEEKQYDFFKNKRELEFVLSKCPKPNRLDIELEDLIKIVHASGGICILAHPTFNLYRTGDYKKAIETIVKSGIDGYEKLNVGNSSMINSKFEATFKKINKKPLISLGSDFHTKTSNTKIGEHSGSKIYRDNYTDVIKTIKKLNPKFEKSTEIDIMLDKYQLKYDEISKDFKKLSEHFYKICIEKKDKVDDKDKYLEYITNPENRDKLTKKESKVLNKYLRQTKSTSNKKDAHHEDEQLF